MSLRRYGVIRLDAELFDMSCMVRLISSSSVGVIRSVSLWSASYVGGVVSSVVGLVLGIGSVAGSGSDVGGDPIFSR